GIVYIESTFFYLSGNGQVGGNRRVFPAAEMFVVFLLEEFGSPCRLIGFPGEDVLFLDDVPFAKDLDHVEQCTVVGGIGLGVCTVLRYGVAQAEYGREVTPLAVEQGLPAVMVDARVGHPERRLSMSGLHSCL